ncbi:MAG: 30S ribosomal protein S6 [Caulobacterales bacterium]|jgi:small subunit ribosomal protein S6
MGYYEHVLIARQDISSQQVEALVEDIIKLVNERGGKISKNEYWGLRTLTYRIRKNRKGHFTLLNIDAPAEAVHELERVQRLNEDILRFMTVRVEALDEEPSPILARKDRDERRRSRREGRDDGDRFDDRDGGFDLGDLGED